MTISLQRLLHSFAILLVPIVLAAVTPPEPAQAQDYPNRPVTFVVPFAPGGLSDVPARVLAAEMQQRIGQSIVVENKPGAAGIIGTEFVAKASPDGYTVLIGQSGALAVNPYLYKLNFDPQKDLAPVDLLITGATVLVTSADSPIKNLKDLIAIAKKEPGKLSYASYGAGHISHLMGEMFKSYAGVDILHVPYKSGPLPDVMAGRVDLIFEGTAVAMPQIKAGRLRPIAVMGAKRIPGLPDVPSVAEEFPGFDAPGWVGVLVPAGTPKPIIDRLNRELNDALASPEIQQRIADMLLEPAGGKPEEFGAFIRSQSERWGKVIRQAGITVE
jgi:tripartite-type tricarboxylate transporter receptor subunit TctC